MVNNKEARRAALFAAVFPVLPIGLNTSPPAAVLFANAECASPLLRLKFPKTLARAGTRAVLSAFRYVERLAALFAIFGDVLFVVTSDGSLGQARATAILSGFCV